MEIPNLVTVLTMLATGVGVGAVLAFLFEKIVWFQNMEPKIKWWVVLVLSIGLPIVARLLIQLVPADVWALLEPYWQSIAAGFLIWAGSQAWHLADKYAQKTEEFINRISA